jgi:type I restriction enzyme M protein
LAVLQDKRDSVKRLELSRASAAQIAAFNKARVEQGDPLVTRSGSIGRVGYITETLDGTTVSEDAIRIRISDPTMRCYVYAWLQSREARDQLLRNEYGAVQQQLEPQDVQDLLTPVLDDWAAVQRLTDGTQAFLDAKELADTSTCDITARLGALVDEQ